MQPKIYKESMLLTMRRYWFIPAIFLIPAIWYLATIPSDELGAIGMPLAICAIAYAVILFFLPVSRLEISENGFTYRKGSKKISSTWMDVNQVAVRLVHKSMEETVGGYDFFIDSKSGVTGLIPLKSLLVESKSSSDSAQLKFIRVDQKDFMREIETLSGKKIVMGEPSIRKYGEIPVSLFS